MNAIVAKNLVKYFNLSKQGMKGMKSGQGRKSIKSVIRAVDNISFEVEKGEIFGFLGPNGAGKTTTIRMLTGVLKPTNGHTEIFGKNFWKNSIQIKQIIGNVPEMANVYPDLTGMENLKFIGELYSIPKKIRLKRAELLLKQFELYEKSNIKAKKYSRGMKQRLLLCMALINEPKILFLDEPTLGLDVQSSRIIKQLIKNYNKKGMTIFLTTHDMNVANELCHRIAIINKGRIVSLDTPENLRRIFQENQIISVAFEHDVKKEDLVTIVSSIKEVNKIKDEWTLLVHDVDQTLKDIVDFAKINHLGIKLLNTLQPSLEEIFLKIIERGAKN